MSVFDLIELFALCSWRSLDGTCNNVEHWNWGARNTQYNRILDAFYDDGECVRVCVVFRSNTPVAEHRTYFLIMNDECFMEFHLSSYFLVQNICH